ETEFEAFGLPFDQRASRFEERFHIIRRLLAGERVSFDGRFEKLHDAVLLPRTPTAPRLMIGSAGERVLRATLPYVDAWNIWCDWYGNTPEGFAKANARVTAISEDGGPDASHDARTATVHGAVRAVDGRRAHRPRHHR